jgi:hypothetical protein
VCKFSFSYFRRCQWWLSVGTPCFWELDSVLKPLAGIELPKEVSTSRVRWMPLIVEWNVSINMFYLLKHILLLILVIFKLKCNNLIFNEIIVLNDSYVCLHAFSLHQESPDLDPGRRTPHFWGGSITAGIRAGLGLNIHSKHLKIPTMFTMRMLSPCKDYNSLLGWQANMCLYNATTELHRWRYVVDFESV